MASEGTYKVIDLDQALQVALKACELAAIEIKQHFASQQKAFLTKSTVIDMVTQTDKRVEEIVSQHLLTNYPDHQIIGEEYNNHDTTLILNGYSWIIDPIDGTTNFVHRNPGVCTSIALACCGQVVMGVVHNPIMNETFYAIKGKGSFQKTPFTNQVFEKNVISQCESIEGSLLSSNFPYGRTEEILGMVEKKYGAFLRRGCHGIRGSGSAVINLCYVANGSLDAYFENGIQIWDMAAGKIIVEEAGGTVCDPIDLDVKEEVLLQKHRCLATCTKSLAAEMVEVLRKIETGE
ncbi:inositol monophosphatase [Naegleria gruberi]|uniref:Inositol-1-monophosphatase n=1 Tax=Naegleria gruberi TaxID=5762 RepID=D2VMQ2_NAEGR|nr:inositol monophosphatase [Naegleria gruberi]EFC41871.1 inositol monophosphatase [Naegleria gruberi]|eukprot:XP_002674615.1 inositol monophosphatase [Naegleria gruberi strain NEG-M]